MSRRQCQACKRNRAVWTIRNAFQSDANGKVVCDNTNCFAQFTLGYPAEGRRIA